MTSTPRSAAVRLVDSVLQECLSDYCHPNEHGGYDTDSQEAAEIAVDTLLANPDVLHALVAASNPVALSPREQQIAVLVSRGMRNKAIAAQLDISVFTVSAFLRRSFAKLGVETRTEMVAVLTERGLLPTTRSGQS